MASLFKVGRNAPCPCGSGKKYKRCCSRADEKAAPSGGGGPVRLKVSDNDIEELVLCTIMMEEDHLTGEERLMYRRRHSDLERKNRIIVAEGRDEDDNPCIFLHPDHVGRNGFIDSRLYRPGDDMALEVSLIVRGYIQVRRIDGDVKVSEVGRIETSHRETLEDDGSWWW